MASAKYAKGLWPLLFLRFQVKRFRFLFALLAFLAPSGSWAAWPGECTKIIFAGQERICSPCNPMNNQTISFDASVPKFNIQNAGLGSTNWYGTYWYGGFSAWYCENGAWKPAANSGTVWVIDPIGAEINGPQPPTGTCGPAPNPPKNLGPPCLSN